MAMNKCPFTMSFIVFIKESWDSHPDLQNTVTSLGHSHVSQTGSAAGTSSNLHKYGRKKDLPVCTAAMESFIPYVQLIVSDCLFVGTNTVLFWEFGSSTLHHESVLYAVVSHWHGTQAAAAAPSRFLSASTLCVLDIKNLGFVIQWQDEDDKDDDELEKSDVDTKATIGYCLWHLACLNHEQLFLTHCKRPMGFQQSEFAVIG